jgi:hypothetical protein
MNDDWRTSGYSNQAGGHCVEVAETRERVVVRATVNRGAGHLAFPVAEWRALLAGLDRMWSGAVGAFAG